MFYQLKKLLKKSKADYTEINLLKSESSELIGEKNQVKGTNILDTLNVFVRVWIGKKQGIAFSNSLNEDVIKKAVKIAKCSKELEFFYGLPARQKYKKVMGLYSSMPTEEEMLLLAKQAIGGIADKKKGSYLSELSLIKSSGQHFLVNSEGIEAAEKTTAFSAGIAAVAKKNGKISSCEDTIVERKLPNVADFAKTVKKELLALLGVKKLKKKVTMIILSPKALASLLGHAFLGNFNAISVIKGRSLFVDKLNKQIVSEKIILRDNGSLSGGTRSSNFDSEGTSMQDIALIEKGMLRSFVHNYNTARHLKTKPTGNGAGSGIGFSNILLKPGKKDIIDNVARNNEKVLLVNSILGAHTANEATTAFSVKANAAYLLDNGKKQPIKDVMLSGKFIEALQDVAAIGNKIKNVCGFYLPAIALRKIDVTAG